MPRAVRIISSAKRAKPILIISFNGNVEEKNTCIPGTPVGALTDGHCVNAFVNALETLSAVDVSEEGPSRRRFDARGSLLVTCNLSRFHGCAEAYG